MVRALLRISTKLDIKKGKAEPLQKHGGTSRVGAPSVRYDMLVLSTTIVRQWLASARHRSATARFQLATACHRPAAVHPL